LGQRSLEKTEKETGLIGAIYTPPHPSSAVITSPSIGHTPAFVPPPAIDLLYETAPETQFNYIPYYSQRPINYTCLLGGYMYLLGYAGWPPERNCHLHEPKKGGPTSGYAVTIDKR